MYEDWEQKRVRNVSTTTDAGGGCFPRKYGKNGETIVRTNRDFCDFDRLARGVENRVEWAERGPIPLESISKVSTRET